jgi:drug/metabolite transporter (DMT)-like permease
MSIITLLIYRLFINPNGFVYNMTVKESFLLFSNGIVMFFCQLLFILSLQLDKASRSAGLQFTAIVFGYVMDMVIFNYSIGWGEVLGAAVIVACSCTALVLKYK